MQDVADSVGVSKMAVSGVLNGKNKTSAQTRAAILEAVERLGYEPNPHAQNLARARVSETIGLLALWFDYGVASQKIHLIQNALNEQGFEVPLYGLGLRDARDEASQVAAIARARRHDLRALVCATNWLRPKALDELRRYQDAGGTLVCYDYAADIACDQVIFDRQASDYQAARHLLELGHRQIVLAFHGFAPTAPERFGGYERALREFGVTPCAEWILQGLDRENYAAGGVTIAQQFLQMAERPTALCIYNDTAAFSFIAEAQRHGVRCPDDISIVGYDDHPLSRHYPVPLTTMAHPAEQIAEGVTRFLLNRLNQEYQGEPRQQTVNSELRVRQSTRRLP